MDRPYGLLPESNTYQTPIFSDGSQRGIREMCGKEAKPTCIAWTTPSLRSFEESCLDRCLSFLIEPSLMSFLCAVAKSILASAHRPSLWCGTIVNTAERRLQGKLAMTHFKSWAGAKAVVGGSWERGSLSFLVDQMWVSWAFVHLREARMLMSRFPVPSLDMSVMFSVNTAVKGSIFVGIATNVNTRSDITSALDGRPLERTGVVSFLRGSAIAD